MFQVVENGDVIVNGSVVHGSSRAVKTNLDSVDARGAHEALSQVPVQRWSFIGDEASTPHLGPMAQDFNAAFGLGGDGRHKGATDADGVALAGIQGPYELVLEQQARIEALEAKLTESSRE